MSSKSAWRSGVLAAAVTVALATPGLAAASEKSFEIYGFAMADYIQDISGRLSPDWDDAFRPSRIGINEQYGKDGQSSISVKQSRFGVLGSMPTSSADPIDFKFEFDFFGTGSDAGQTTIRLRHFYGEWGQILAGQTHSLFMDIDVFPNTIDYWGPAGMVFYRNVQLRWTPYRTSNSHFAVAIERPGNDIDPGNIRLIDGFEDLEIQNDEKMPDITAQYRFNGDWGHVQAGGIYRRVGYELRNPDGDGGWTDGSENGWGINLSSNIRVGDKNRIILSVVYGEGIASYMNDGGMDLAPAAEYDGSGTLADVEAEVVELLGVVAYYDHWWNDKWSSAIGYSFTEVDNTNFQDPGAFKKGQYASVNLLYYPTDNLMLGGELLWGERENNNGASDDAYRFQFSVKYNFGARIN